MTDSQPRNNTQPGEDTPRGSRPSVRRTIEEPPLVVGDPVFLLKDDGSREGPYVVATAPNSQNGKCALSYPNGSPFRNNEGISVDRLEPTN